MYGMNALNSDILDHTSFEGDDFVCDINLVNGKNIGPKAEKRKRDMLHVEQIMQDAGWFDESSNGPAEIGDLTPVLSAQLQSGKDWTAIVQRKQQELIDERCKNIPDNVNDINKTGYGAESLAEVKIVDKTYLTAKFKAKAEKEQNIIDSTVSDFLLNTDQERAFHIIANHASTEKPEQLIMYIGGMAGTGKSQVIKALTAFFERQNESHHIVITAPWVLQLH
jgi:chromosomal replication initiation ATPase DnaA